MSAGSALAPDAAMALGIASTAMPFARTPEDEAERWLRVLRTHGEAGIALKALGVSEGPLETSREISLETPRESSLEDSPEDSSDRQRGSIASGGAAGGDRDAVAQVTEQALDIAGRRGAGGAGTLDLLMAVMDIYGEEFDRVLRAHGTDRDEVLERLVAERRRGAT
jgi:hypothetical protein